MKRKSKIYLVIFITMIVSIVLLLASLISYTIIHLDENSSFWRTSDYVTIPVMMVSLVLAAVSQIIFLVFIIKAYRDALKVGKSTHRSTFEISYEGKKAEIAKEIDQYLKSNKFVITRHSTGEMLYKKGDGLGSYEVLKVYF